MNPAASSPLNQTSSGASSKMRRFRRRAEAVLRNDTARPARWRRLLITGAAGEISRVIRPALRGCAESLRLHDLRPIPDLAPGEEAIRGNLAEPGAAATAMQGVECLIHLAGIPREAGGAPDEIFCANVLGTHEVFAAARQAG